MKNITFLLLIVLVAAACGGDKTKETVADIIESGTQVQIQEKRDAIAAQQQILNAQLKDLDAKLQELNPEMPSRLLQSTLL